MMIAINNEIYVGIPLLNEKREVYSTRYIKLPSKKLFPYFIDQEITGGLGYEKLNHHKNTQKGLRRHLAEMELKIEKREHTFEHEISRQMLITILSLEEVIMDVAINLKKRAPLN